MFLTGFADEASPDFRKQIEATKKLGWSHIESRAIGTKNLASVSDAEFEEIQQLLTESGVSVNSFGSGIANWSKKPRSDADFEADKTELLNAIPRMKKLGTKIVRGMSYSLPDNEKFDNPELEKIIFRKVGELVRICADNGILYGHENCSNYAGQSFIHTKRLLDAVQSPALTLIFDTGNPVSTYRRIGPEPYTIQSSWEFYSQVREFISYVHIKDGVWNFDVEGNLHVKYTYPGDGCGDVRAIVSDLIRTGYDGGFSMEPHVAVVFHEKDPKDDSELLARRRFDTYVEYGKRFETLLKECQAHVQAGE